MNLPEHIIKVSDKWYKNTLNGKFIPATGIEKWCENYWKHRDAKAVKAQKAWEKAERDAQNRWFDKD